MTIPIINFWHPSPGITNLKEYTATLPSREERHAFREVVKAQCGNCLQLKPRGELRDCGRCREVTYCSKECQKSHWHRGHKSHCCPPVQGGLTMKLTERAAILPSVIDHLSLLAILSLELHKDCANASHFGLHVQCDTVSVDIDARSERSIVSGSDASAGRDPNAQVYFSVTSVSCVPIHSMTDDLRLKIEDAKRMARESGMEDGVVVTIVLSEANEDITTGASTSPHGFVLMTPILDQEIEFIRNNPTSMIHIGGFEAGEVDLTAEVVREALNSHIRMDTENKLRLRAYPTAAR